jgi:hypothetical protein
MRGNIVCSLERLDLQTCVGSLMILKSQHGLMISICCFHKYWSVGELRWEVHKIVGNRQYGSPARRNEARLIGE